jgi:hypothetical protein
VLALTRIGNPGLAVASRVFAALCGGYLAAVGLVALASALLAVVFGLARSEALILTTMLGFILYAALILWAFSEPRLGRVWLAVWGVAIISHAGAIALARLLPQGAALG